MEQSGTSGSNAPVKSYFVGAGEDIAHAVTPEGLRDLLVSHIQSASIDSRLGWRPHSTPPRFRDLALNLGAEQEIQERISLGMEEFIGTEAVPPTFEIGDTLDKLYEFAIQARTIRENQFFLVPFDFSESGDEGKDAALLSKDDESDRSLVEVIQDTSKILSSGDRGRFELHFEDLYFATRQERSAAAEVDWSPVIGMMTEVSGRIARQEFGEGAGGYQDSWSDVLFPACELLQEWFRRPGRLPSRILGAHGQGVLEFIVQMLEHTSSPSALGDLCTTPEGTRNLDPLSDVAAAETLRASAIGLLLAFVDETSGRGTGPALSPAIKNLCERALARETSPVPMFQFGYNLDVLYRCDPGWTRKILPRVFPKSKARRLLYLGAWTGFLSERPDPDMFADPAIRDLYVRGVGMRTKESERYRSKDHFEPELGIANHLASALLWFDDFGFDDEFLQSFLAQASPEQLAQFVEFAGEMVGGDSGPPSSGKNPELLKFWEWLLRTCDDDLPFLEMGTWMNAKNGRFDGTTLARLTLSTLRKTGGDLSNYSELCASVLPLAKVAPRDTLAIIGLILHGRGYDLPARYQDVRLFGQWDRAVELIGRRAPLRGEASEILRGIRELRERRPAHKRKPRKVVGRIGRWASHQGGASAVLRAVKKLRQRRQIHQGESHV